MRWIFSLFLFQWTIVSSSLAIQSHDSVFRKQEAIIQAAGTITPNSLFGDFVGVSVDSTGNYVAAVSKEDGLYLSSNGGNSYTLFKPSTNLVNYYDVALATAVPQTVVITTDNGIYYSTNFGQTFKLSSIPSPASGSWNKVVLSSDGKYAYTTATTSSKIFASTNYSSTFTTLSSSNPAVYLDIATSSSGQYVYAVSQSTLYYSSTYGATWSAYSSTPPNSDPATFSVSCSSSGQYVYLTPQAFLSYNYGASWKSTAGLFPGASSGGGEIAMRSAFSNTGSILVVAIQNGEIYLSGNSGNTFTVSPVGGQDVWGSLTMSQTGQIIFAGVSGGGYLYRSTTTGYSWSPSYATWTSGVWTMSGASVFIATGDNAALYISLSYNYGQQWTSFYHSDTIGGAVTMTCDYTGTTIYLATNTNLLYRLTSSTTTLLTPPLSPTTTSLTIQAFYVNVYSPNLMVVAYGNTVGTDTSTGSTSGALYYSNNGGYTWVIASAPRANWMGITGYSTLLYAFTGGVGGVVYTSKNTGMTWTQINTIPGDNTNNFTSILTNTYDGMTVLLTTIDTIYHSVDGGMTWNTIPVTKMVGEGQRIVDSAMASRGQFLYVLTTPITVTNTTSPISYTGTSMGYVLKSVDGIHWNTTYNVTLPYGNGNGNTGNVVPRLSSIQCDGLGQFVTVTVCNGGVYSSKNYGLNWGSTATPLTLPTFTPVSYPSTPPTVSPPASSPANNAGTIAGITVGTLFGFGILCLVVVIMVMNYLRRHRITVSTIFDLSFFSSPSNHQHQSNGQLPVHAFPTTTTTAPYGNTDNGNTGEGDRMSSVETPPALNPFYSTSIASTSVAAASAPPLPSVYTMQGMGQGVGGMAVAYAYPVSDPSLFTNADVNTITAPVPVPVPAVAAIEMQGNDNNNKKLG